jgi:hypothetical protein
MVLNGYPDAQLEGKSNLTMADLPNAWNGVSWGQEFKLYDGATLKTQPAQSPEGTEIDFANTPLPELDQPPEGAPIAVSAEVPGSADGSSAPAVAMESPGSADGSSAPDAIVAPAAASVYWDPELDTVNAGLQPVQGLNPGDKYWKLVGAEFLPPGNEQGQAGGRHHIYYRVNDENGNAIVGAGIAMGWQDGQSHDVTKPDEGGLGNQPMYASFAPDRGEKGGYFAFVTANGLPSDKVDGLGLPGNQHVAYMLTYQLATWGQ